jgi:hypothetical protein
MAAHLSTPRSTPAAANLYGAYSLFLFVGGGV